MTCARSWPWSIRESKNVSSSWFASWPWLFDSVMAGWVLTCSFFRGWWWWWWDLDERNPWALHVEKLGGWCLGDGADPSLKLQVSQSPCALLTCHGSVSSWTMNHGIEGLIPGHFQNLLCSPVSFFLQSWQSYTWRSRVTVSLTEWGSLEVAGCVRSYMRVCISVDFGFLCLFLITWLCNNFSMPWRC